MRKRGFGHMLRPRSACVSTQSHQDLPCPLTESLDTTGCMNGEQRPGYYLVHAQNDLNLRMFEGFSLDATHGCLTDLLHLKQLTEHGNYLNNIVIGPCQV